MTVYIKLNFLIEIDLIKTNNQFLNIKLER